MFILEELVSKNMGMEFIGLHAITGWLNVANNNAATVKYNEFAFIGAGVAF